MRRTLHGLTYQDRNGKAEVLLNQNLSNRKKKVKRLNPELITLINDIIKLKLKILVTLLNKIITKLKRKDEYGIVRLIVWITDLRRVNSSHYRGGSLPKSRRRRRRKVSMTFSLTRKSFTDLIYKQHCNVFYS